MIRQIRLILASPVLRLMALVALLHGCASAGVGIYQSLLAIKIFGLSDSSLALMLFIAPLVNVGAAIGIGIVTDQRPSRKAMAILAATALLAAALVVSIHPSAVTFVIAQMILGPIAGTIFGQFFAVTRLASQHIPKADRDGIMAIIRALFAMPFMSVVPLWGQIIKHGAPMITIYHANIGIAAVLLLIIVLWWPADRTAPWVETKSGLNFRASIAEMLERPLVARVALLGLVHVAQAINGVTAGLIFAEHRDGGQAEVALFFGIFVGIEVIFTLLVGEFVRYLPRLKVIALGAFTYAGFMFLFPFLVDGWGIWLLTIPAGAGGALIYALAIGYVQDLMGQRAGAGTSLVALQRLVSDSTCAALFAFGTWVGGYSLVVILGATVTAGAMGALLWVDRDRL